MSSSIESLISREYEAGFVTDIEADTLPPGLSADVVRAISAKKSEPAFMLVWRLKAYKRWLTMPRPPFVQTLGVRLDRLPNLGGYWFTLEAGALADPKPLDVLPTPDVQPPVE